VIQILDKSGSVAWSHKVLYPWDGFLSLDVPRVEDAVSARIIWKSGERDDFDFRRGMATVSRFRRGSGFISELCGLLGRDQSG
jgi:hypothetical protein